MKRAIILLFALFLCGSSLAAQNKKPAPSKNAPQTNKPLMVSDYFLLLPKPYINLTPQARKLLLNAPSGVTIDNQDGYLNFNESPTSQSVIVLFKKPDGSNLIGLTRTKASAAKKSGEDGDEECELYVLSYDGKQFVEVTKETIPMAVNKKYYYDLSRKGTFVRVENGDGDLVYSFIWDNGKFTLKR